jgi:AcrR family transcriptional regulator
VVRPSCKSLILDAAEAFVLDVGAANLTIDGVAERAGLSKGGVLYHFPTKESLLVEMLSRRLEAGRADRQAVLEKTEPGPAQRLKADITALLQYKNEQDKRFASAFLAAIANEPKLMETVRAYHHERFAAHGSEGAEFEDKCLLLLAADGLFLLEVLQISPFSPEQRERLVHRLLEAVNQPFIPH